VDGAEPDVALLYRSHTGVAEDYAALTRLPAHYRLVPFVLVLRWIWPNGCVTVHVGEEDEWVMTSCPATPSNITQMLRVGAS